MSIATCNCHLLRFLFIIFYRAATLLANSFLPLAFQNAVDVTWAGFPAALGLLAVDVAAFLGFVSLAMFDTEENAFRFLHFSRRE